MSLDRILILAAILAAASVLALLWRRYSQYRLSRLMNADVPESVRNLVIGDKLAILYFTTRDCAQCRFQQSPILERLAQHGRVTVYPVDAVDSQDLVHFYGIMTVPSTVLLTAKLQPLAINHGFASSDRLVQQIATFCT